jgi:hypothetical protein
MGALHQDGLADGTVGRNITLTLKPERQENGSTTAYRVANSDQEIPLLQRIGARELVLENWEEDNFIVI